MADGTEKSNLTKSFLERINSRNDSNLNLTVEIKDFELDDLVKDVYELAQTPENSDIPAKDINLINKKHKYVASLNKANSHMLNAKRVANFFIDQEKAILRMEKKAIFYSFMNKVLNTIGVYATLILISLAAYKLFDMRLVLVTFDSKAESTQQQPAKLSGKQLKELLPKS